MARWTPFARRAVATPERPRLSVVVPVYAVERWLPACLDSIAAQTFGDYEVVVVDDGSPDDSAALVERRARRDGRLRLHRQANAGLGAARNTGVGLARGELLAFVDSDDDLPPYAFERMVDVLDATGADIVIGAADRVSADGSHRQGALMRRNHDRERLGVTVEEWPLALADVFAWNKVYRRDFWDAAGLAFPAGTAYEDQPALTQALLAARSISLIPDVVYHWRRRDDGTSLTDRRHTLADLRDRIDTKRASLEAVRRQASGGVLRVFLADVLPIDLRLYFRNAVSPHVEDPDTYWRLLREEMMPLWSDDTVPFHRTSITVGQRLMGWLVAQDRRDDLARFVALVDGPGVPVQDGEYLHPWHDEPGLPDELKHA